MTPQEVFKYCHPNSDMLHSYWMVERELAENEGRVFSEWPQSAEERTCRVCGTVNETNEDGYIPGDGYSADCQNAQCAEVKKYFNLRGNTRLRGCGGVHDTGRRYSWLIGHMKLHEMERAYPAGSLLTYLAAMMLKRMSIDLKKEEHGTSEHRKNQRRASECIV